MRWTKYKRKYDLFARVFSGPEGEEVLALIVEMGYVNKPTFAPLCPNKTFVNEGARTLALEIIKLAKKNPANLVAQSHNNNQLKYDE